MPLGAMVTFGHNLVIFNTLPSLRHRQGDLVLGRLHHHEGVGLPHVRQTRDPFGEQLAVVCDIPRVHLRQIVEAAGGHVTGLGRRGAPYGRIELLERRGERAAQGVLVSFTRLASSKGGDAAVRLQFADDLALDAVGGLPSGNRVQTVGALRRFSHRDVDFRDKNGVI